MINSSNENYYAIKQQIEKGIKRLDGEEFYFYGTFNNCFKIDDMILEVLEDPEDGYRSSMGAVCHYESYNDLLPRFFKRPLGKVVLEECDGCIIKDEWDNDEGMRGWVLRDVDTDHLWLTFGTCNYDDYYPYFVFKYTPDKTQTTFPTIDPNYIPFKERHPELILKYPEWFSGIRLEMGY